MADGQTRQIESAGAAAAGPWVARLPFDKLESSAEGVDSFESFTVRLIGRLRGLPGIFAYADRQFLWLRGDAMSEGISQTLRSLPAAERFQISGDNQLTAWDETVPREQLPDATWVPLVRWIDLQLPMAAFAAPVKERVPLVLVRSDVPRDTNLLRTNWSTWYDYATSAPQIRLNQCSFALSDGQEVLVRGAVIPPLAGERFAERHGVAIPVGFRLEPELEGETLRSALELQTGELAVFHQDGSMEVVPESAFVHATRSAVRLTGDAISNPT